MPRVKVCVCIVSAQASCNSELCGFADVFYFYGASKKLHASDVGVDASHWHFRRNYSLVCPVTFHYIPEIVKPLCGCLLSAAFGMVNLKQ